MINKIKKRSDQLLIGLACIIVGLIIFRYALNLNAQSSRTAGQSGGSATNLVITCLNVGKADAAVIRLGDVTGMIDTGTKDQYETITMFLKGSGIDSLDFLILTHYDKDHIGCAKKIIKEYDIGRILIADYVSQKKYYEPLMDCLEDLDNVDRIDIRTDYRFGELSLDIMPASDPEALTEDPDELDNNMSLVAMLQYKNENFLFTGDIEKDRIEQLLTDGYDLDADWIKMPHHGTCEGDDSGYLRKNLLMKTTPEYAVISTSGVQAGKADVISTTKLLSDENIAEYTTCNGNVTTISDGTEITVTQ